MTEKHEFQRSPNMVNGLHHIGIPVNDLDRAIAFYTNILGMEFKERNEEADTRGHFISSNVPPNVNYESPEGEEDLVNFKLRYQRIRPGEVLGISVARLQAANVEIVLFERPVPIQTDSLVENGILHHSFHVSMDGFQRLLSMKAANTGAVAFSTGPVLRWPHGWALYLWDSEGNYLELEVEDNLAEKSEPLVNYRPHAHP